MKPRDPICDSGFLYGSEQLCKSALEEEVGHADG